MFPGCPVGSDISLGYGGEERPGLWVRKGDELIIMGPVHADGLCPEEKCGCESLSAEPHALCVMQSSPGQLVGLL